MSKEKVTVVTAPGQVPRVFKTRRDGADAARERTIKDYGYLGMASKRSLGGFVEDQYDHGRAGDTHVQEVELEDPQ